MSLQGKVPPDGQKVFPGQKLTEEWQISVEAGKDAAAPLVARLHVWPNSTYYMVRGYGKTVEEARLDLVSKLAAAIHDDPNPFGAAKRTVFLNDMHRWLKSTIDAGDVGEAREPSDNYLPNNLMRGETLPNGWDKVVQMLIQSFEAEHELYDDNLHDITDPGPTETGGPQ